MTLQTRRKTDRGHKVVMLRTRKGGRFERVTAFYGKGAKAPYRVVID